MSNKKYRKIAAATLAALTASASGNLLSVSAASEACAIPVIEQPPVTPTPLVKTIYKLEVPTDGAISAPQLIGANDGTVAAPAEPEYKELLEKEGRHEDSLEMIDSLSDLIRERWSEFKDYYPGEETVAVFDGTDGGGATPSESTPKEGRLVEFKTTKEEDGNLVHIYVVHREEETITASAENENVIANFIAKAVDLINPIEEVHAMEHIYREIPAPITPTTVYKTRDGQILEGPVDGLQEQKDFENYNCVEVIETPEGNREFIYEPITPPAEEPEEPVNPPVEEQPEPEQPQPEQPEPEQPQPEEPTNPEVPAVKTYFRGPDRDIEPPVDGTTGNKEIPGYTFINTEEDLDGNTIHNYVKNKTRFVRQDDRTEISETVEDFVDEKEITNFIFVETENNPGERIHIYKSAVTKFVDENGEPVSPDEEGIVEKKDFPNFRFVETKETPEGQTHKYESVKTHFVDEAKQPLLESKNGLVESEKIEGFKVIETNELDNGDREHVYAPIVNRFVGPNGEELSPPENGVIEVKEIPNMRFLRTEELPNGDKDHHYEHIQTHFVDLEGLKLTPSENGLLESREFENYKLVETREEDNGDRTHIYAKVVTNFIENKNGTEISPSEDGLVEKKEIPNYRFIETRELPNGSVSHVYEMVTTRFVNEENEPVSPEEEGVVEPKEIPGLELVETKTEDNGDITHIYRLTNNLFTYYRDEEENDLATPEQGHFEPKEFENYEFIGTTLGENFVIHIYRPKTLITKFVDENGKELLPFENGTLDKRDIPKYEFVKSETDSAGNVTHIYRPIEIFTHFVDTEGTQLVPSLDDEREEKQVDGYDYKETKRIGNNIYHIYDKKPVVVKEEMVEEEPKVEEVVKEEPVVLSGEAGVKTEEPKAVSEKPQVKTGNSSSLLSTLATGILSIAAYIGLRKRED